MPLIFRTVVIYGLVFGLSCLILLVSLKYSPILPKITQIKIYIVQLENPNLWAGFLAVAITTLLILKRICRCTSIPSIVHEELETLTIDRLDVQDSIDLIVTDEIVKPQTDSITIIIETIRPTITFNDFDVVPEKKEHMTLVLATVIYKTLKGINLGENGSLEFTKACKFEGLYSDSSLVYRSMIQELLLKFYTVQVYYLKGV